MPIQTDSLNRKLYDLLNTRGYDPKPMDSDAANAGKTVPPEEADVFKFVFKQDEKDIDDVWVTVDGAQNLILYYDKDVASKSSGKTPGIQFDDSWYGLLNFLKKWAQARQLSFKLEPKEKINSDMAQRTYMKKKEQIAEGYYSMGKSASYSDAVPTVKIVLQHTRQIQEGEQRYRNVAKIFLENQAGERILCPTNKPGVAQVYARHLAEGGVPNDDRWNHIKGLCEEYSKMAGFVRAVRGNEFNESAQRLVNEGLNHYQSLRESLGKMRGHRGYTAYFESYTPALMETEGDETNLNELFVQETLDPRIESVIPILSKLSKNLGEMKEVKELDEWASGLIEGDGGQEALNPIGIPEDEEIKDKADYLTKRKALQKIQLDPESGKDKALMNNMRKRKAELERQAKEKGFELAEDLGPEQKRVGQLGPIEKVKNNNIGKLVGANESYYRRDDAYERDVKNAETGFGGRQNKAGFEMDAEEWFIVRDGKMYKLSIFPNQVRAAIAQGYSPTREEAKEKAGLSEDLNESHMSNVDIIMQELGSGVRDIYDTMNSPKTPDEQYIARILQDMYDEISLEHRLHPDDDFEQIIDIMGDQIAQAHPSDEVDENRDVDYGAQEGGPEWERYDDSSSDDDWEYEKGEQENLDAEDDELNEVWANRTDTTTKRDDARTVAAIKKRLGVGTKKPGTTQSKPAEEGQSDLDTIKRLLGK